MFLVILIIYLNYILCLSFHNELHIRKYGVNIDVTLNDGANDTYIVKDAPVPVGGALVPIGGNQKIVMVTGDSIKVNSSAASSVDAVLSVLEIT